ncbi:hypothetical protein N7532_006663 [Penicillium argentinense]|uniref:Ubiquitin-like protease family profile domain-containing protein n=1 Tax=Penicillium argentinense TaxID=1131581 RepID=A0A9W9KC67_9EURO|nr:uncharacterized protein N7532_006663 [Penicillium argentinense]KAJ5099662.1 hypothetical protein N7532_006663 [Penicillium argentinense]
MSNKTKIPDDRQNRAEEARLFGATYRYALLLVVGSHELKDIRLTFFSFFVSDKNAVKIVPGASKKKVNPGASAAPKPIDRISHNQRDSGPVRAQGKSAQGKAELASYPKMNRPRADEALEPEQSTRPSKRHRHDGNTKTHDLTYGKYTRKGGDMGHRHHASRFSSVQKKITSNQQHLEFRDVEGSVMVPRSPVQGRRSSVQSESPTDEKFTSQAKKQRLAGPEANASRREGIASNLATPASRQILDSRESPDELQGDVTTKPLPRQLNDKQKRVREGKNKHLSPSPTRKRSPTDIQPTEFASSPPRGRRGSNAITNLRGNPSVLCIFDLVLDESIDLGEFGSHGHMSIPLRQIQMIFHGSKPSCKVRVMLSQRIEGLDDRVDIEFTELAQKGRFMASIQAQEVKTKGKWRRDIDSVFKTYEQDMAGHGDGPGKPLIDSSSAEPGQPPSSPPPRQKLSSALQGDPLEPTKERSGIRKFENIPKADPPAKNRERSERENESDIGLPKKKKLKQTNLTGEQSHSTERRSARLSNVTKDHDHDTIEQLPKFPLKDDPFRKNWEHPLIYPPYGKKKAEVALEDRDRLRDDEFLNDNLIAFYMRFLQDHLERTNKEAAKQIYFFNSYFYDTLTKMPRGQRGINYNGVAKWTRNVDLFSYDYVVVPINQSAHWYVAIICNLPSLLGDSDGEAEAQSDDESTPAAAKDTEPSSESRSEVQEVPESPEPEFNPSTLSITETTAQKAQSPTSSESPNSQNAERSLNSKISALALGATPPEIQTDSIHTSQQTSSPKKKGNAGHKLDPSQTTIITFDSLDLGRSPTIKILRDYICQESTSKRGKDVDPKDIKGMRARQIPLQNNYSDCGLYLLAYLEKFAQDPDQFIIKLLQREMEQEDWPPFGSGLLRQRLRDFLDRLYQEQDKVNNGQSAGEKILADQQPVSYLLGSCASEANVEVKKENMDEPLKHEDPPLAEEATKNSPPSSPSVQAQKEPEDDSADQLQLVPNNTTPLTSTDKSSKTSTANDPPKLLPSALEDDDVVEVPDSQKAKQVSSSNCSEVKPASENKASKKRVKNKAAKESHAPADKKKHHKNVTIAAESDHPLDPRHSKPTKKRAPAVEIQVRASPTPSSPKEARKSSHGNSRKD